MGNSSGERPAHREKIPTADMRTLQEQNPYDSFVAFPAAMR
jgi:hypothetical protein